MERQVRRSSYLRRAALYALRHAALRSIISRTKIIVSSLGFDQICSLRKVSRKCRVCIASLLLELEFPNRKAASIVPSLALDRSQHFRQRPTKIGSRITSRGTKMISKHCELAFLRSCSQVLFKNRKLRF